MISWGQCLRAAGLLENVTTAARAETLTTILQTVGEGYRLCKPLPVDCLHDLRAIAAHIRLHARAVRFEEQT